MLDSLSRSFTFIILSYYKLFLYITLCLSVMLDTLMFIYIYVISYYKLFPYFTLRLRIV